MAQLKMYWFPGTPIVDEPLPEGYSFSNYRSEADKKDWCEICRNNGEHIGTVTAYLIRSENKGDMHMVAIRNDFRGRKLSKYLCILTCKKLEATGCKFIELTTDEWRKGAVKGYLNAGFIPVEYDEGMEERWSLVLEDYGIDSVKMVNEDGSFYKTVYRKGLC